MKLATAILCAGTCAWAQPGLVPVPAPTCQPSTAPTQAPTNQLPASTPPANGPAHGWDNSGDQLLAPTAAGSSAGTYYFRYIQYTVGDQQGDLSHAVVLYGSMVFTPGTGKASGTYKITAAQKLDSNSIPLVPSAFPPGTGNAYSIGACGFGFIQNPLSQGDVIWGGVGANGVFVGSSTETRGQFNDLFVAAPLYYAYQMPSASATSTGTASSSTMTSGPPSESTLSGTYSVAYLNFPGGLVAEAESAGFQMTADGRGGVGPVNILMYQGNSSTPIELEESASYFSADGAEVLSFPSTGYALAGAKYVYTTPDGSVIFGGGPDSFDFFVGVQTQGPVSPASQIPGFAAGDFTGLFYQAGIGDLIGANNVGSLQSFYGSFEPVSGTLLDHKRLLIPLGSEAQAPSAPSGCFTFLVSASCPNYAFSSTTAEAYSVGFGPNTGYMDASSGTQYVLNANGAARLGWGVYPNLGIALAVQAPTFTPSAPNTPLPTTTSTSATPQQACGALSNPSDQAPLYIYPNGVVNGGSYAPFTAGISPGELITIFGSGLSAVTEVYFNGDSVQVTPTACGQLSVVVPQAVSGVLATGDSVQIVVGTSASQFSNPVWAYVNTTTIGVISLTSNGIGAAAVTSSTPVSASSAQPLDLSSVTAGTTVMVAVVGLGPDFSESTSPESTPTIPPFTIGFLSPSSAYAQTMLSPPSPGASGFTPGSASTASEAGIAYISLTVPSSPGTYLLTIGTTDSVNAQTTINVKAQD